MVQKDDLPLQFCNLVSWALQMDGVSRNRLKQIKSWVQTTEYINRELHGSSVFISGSFVEASQISGSDIDQMHILPRISAVQTEQKSLDKKDHLLVMETADVRHGFSKLKLETFWEGEDEDQELSRGRTILEKSLVHNKAGSRYISSDKFTAFLLNIMSDTNKYSSLGLSTSPMFRHGPCTTFEYKEFLESDVAAGIECNEWPTEAEEWCTRSRSKGWPSKDTTERLKKLPCYLLPVGDVTSKSYALEWRFAFVPTEREFMWELNDTQIQCFVILKLLKKQFLEPLAPDQLSSFFLKTIIFWQTENNGLEPWKPVNLLQCINQCLQHLKNSILMLDLPHYIFKKRNLLFSRFQDKDMQAKVLKKIEEIQENLMIHILDSTSEDGPLKVLNSLWTSCNGSLSNLIKEGNAVLPNEPRLLEVIDQLDKYSKIDGVLLSIVHLPTTVEKLFSVAEYMKRNEGKLEESFRNTAYSFLVVQLGNHLIPEILKPESFAPREELINTATGLFTQGENMDYAAGPLYLATFYYKIGKQYKAMQIISAVSGKKDILFFAGSCATKKTLTEQPNAGKQGLVQLVGPWVALDVIFTSDDVTWAPDAVKFECALLGDQNNWNFCLFHPLVYAYYLLFQICLERNNKKGCSVSVEELCNILHFDGGDTDRHRAYNLLGFCYYKSGFYQEAIICFDHSLKIMNSVGNAAVYHFCILCIEIMAKQKRQTAQEELVEEIIYQRVRHTM